MKSLKENYGLYAILLVLIYFLGLFLYQFKFGASYWIQRTNLLFGPYSGIFLILLIVSILSIFLNYKFNWITISLPFLWNLLLPLKVDPMMGFRGSIINLFVALFQADFNGVFILLAGSLLSLLCVAYLVIKNLKEIKDNKFEIILSILILIVLLIRIF